MPKIPGSAVWVDGGSFAELENVGGRAGSSFIMPPGILASWIRMVTGGGKT